MTPPFSLRRAAAPVVLSVAFLLPPASITGTGPTGWLSPALGASDARAQGPSEIDRLRPLRDRLATLQARARRGEIGLLPGPSGPGAPPWLVVDPDDLRGQLAALYLSGAITRPELIRRGTALRRDFATGLARLDGTLAEVDARIRVHETGAPSVPPTAEAPTADLDRPSPTADPGKPAPPPPGSGAAERWEVHLTGVGGAGEARALSSVKARLDLRLAPDGAATGRVTYEGEASEAGTVGGSVRDRRVLLRFPGPGGSGEAVLTGVVDASGRHVNGRYRITDGSGGVVRGSWRAARP